MISDNSITIELIKKKIVHCRRRYPNHKKVYKDLENIIYNQTEELCRVLDTRWIVSLCDTVVDYSSDEAEAARAMIISVFVNTVKLMITAEKMFGEQDIDEETCAKMVKSQPLDEWKGMTTLGLNKERGNATYNLFRRMNNCLAETPYQQLLHKVFLETTHPDHPIMRVHEKHGNIYKNAYNKKFIKTPTNRYAA